MNRVFPNQLRKARGVLFFSKAERQVLAAAAAASVLVAVVVHLFLGVGVFVAVMASVIVHRSADNHRVDHLEILTRKTFKPPVWNQCGRDCEHREYRHGT